LKISAKLKFRHDGFFWALDFREQAEDEGEGVFFGHLKNSLDKTEKMCILSIGKFEFLKGLIMEKSFQKDILCKTILVGLPAV